MGEGGWPSPQTEHFCAHVTSLLPTAWYWIAKRSHHSALLWCCFTQVTTRYFTGSKFYIKYTTNLLVQKRPLMLKHMCNEGHIGALELLVFHGKALDQHLYWLKYHARTWAVYFSHTWKTQAFMKALLLTSGYALLEKRFVNITDKLKK